MVNAEQEQLAGQLSRAMAEKFNVRPEEFAVVETLGEGSPQAAVVFAAEYALPVDTSIKLGRLALPGLKGDWRSFFQPRNRERYLVEIGGQEIDTRFGMVFKVYEAMVRRAEAQGGTLPDSREVFDPKKAMQFHPGTFLTGEQAYWDGLEYRVPVGRVSRTTVAPQKGSVTLYNRHPFIGFRPAVLLESRSQCQ